MEDEDGVGGEPLKGAGELGVEPGEGGLFIEEAGREAEQRGDASISGKDEGLETGVVDGGDDGPEGDEEELDALTLIEEGGESPLGPVQFVGRDEDRGLCAQLNASRTVAARAALRSSLTMMVSVTIQRIPSASIRGASGRS